MYAGSDVAVTGTDASGVTKSIQAHHIVVGSQQMKILDVPGYGGNSGAPYRLSLDLNNVLQNQHVHGILVCVSMTNIRFEMANHFISELVNHFIEGASKWDKVVFVLTMENVAKMVPSFPNREQAIPSFIQAVQDKLPQCPVNNIVCVGQSAAECTELTCQLQRLAPQPPLPKPTAGKAMGGIFVDLMEKVWNIPKDVIIEELKKEGSCMTAGTLISTPEGPVPVEELEEGQLVLGRGDSVHRVACVVQTYLGNRSLIGINDGAPCFTPEHVFRASDGRHVVRDHDQLRRERFLLDLEKVGELQGSVLDTLGGAIEVTHLTTADSVAGTPVYEVVLENACVDPDVMYYANGLPCVSSFPEVIEHMEFFMMLEQLAAAFPAEEFPPTYAGQAALFSAAYDVVSQNADKLKNALEQPSLGIGRVQQPPADVTAMLRTRFDHFTTTCWPSGAKTAFTVVFYMYMASGIVLTDASEGLGFAILDQIGPRAVVAW